ncbi:pseudouridine synthase [Pavlovales sp. CCMP2436]|nr:pseudouridine synthase [Pavlovales sp. CCMP2436]|mmetsp:Transcript_36460/g.90942  ORF Transcript_36460/g.90942 Transcript_36460/m.90942 type:complete len:329 (+) Transcript_36460:41-1027(+)
MLGLRLLYVAHAASARALRLRAPLRHLSDLSELQGGGRACSATMASAQTAEPAATQRGGDLHGLILVRKPHGWTSRQVVDSIGISLDRFQPLPRAAGEKRLRHKVGHGGTLDPLATGLLVIGVGRGCRELAPYLKGSKAYRALATFGTETTTQDSSGEVNRTASASHITLEAIQAALPALTGSIMQRPPAYSAIRFNGNRSYDLARKGKLKDEDMTPREVEVFELRATALERVELADESSSLVAELFVECGGGVYIRSLIVDIARALGSAAHMSALERVKQGPFLLDGGSVRVLTMKESWKHSQQDSKQAVAIMEAFDSAASHSRSAQ